MAKDEAYERLRTLEAVQEGTAAPGMPANQGNGPEILNHAPGLPTLLSYALSNIVGDDDYDEVYQPPGPPSVQ